MPPRRHLLRPNYGRSFRRDPWYTRGGPLLALAVVVVVVGIGFLVADYAKLDTVTMTVDEKESVAQGSSGHEYRVYTDKGTFVVKDSFVRPRFNSADVYARIKPGTTYRCEKFGWRAPFFSMFENLRKCQPVG